MNLPDFSHFYSASEEKSFLNNSSQLQSLRKSTEFHSGMVLSHFRILDKLNEGGMGIVYKALDLNLQRPVALKLLPPELSRRQEKKQQFLEEARILSAIDHPNICTVHEIFETEYNGLIMVMPCYEGNSLRSVLSRKSMSEQYAISLTKQITSGLAKAHENNIIHQDVKPENIMVTNDNIVKIIDFGIATLYGNRSKGNTNFSGTAAYMSPEQIERQQVDFRADIWSLGVVLYEMLSGDLPFQGHYEQEFVYSILNESPATMEMIPEPLQMIVFKCLEKDRTLRYGSMRDVLTDLEVYQTRQRRLKEKAERNESKKTARLWSGVAMLWPFFMRAGNLS